MRLPGAQSAILRDMASGLHLKNHRNFDGSKVCLLHDSSGAVVCAVSAGDVEQLEKRGLIAGNMKFPATTYLLTARGAHVAEALTGAQGGPVRTRIPGER